MNRLVVAGLLGLALAGCTSNGSGPPEARRTLPEVGLTTFPSIHQAINGDHAPTPTAPPRVQTAARPPTPASAAAPTDPALAMAGNAQAPAPLPETAPTAPAESGPLASDLPMTPAATAEPTPAPAQVPAREPAPMPGPTEAPPLTATPSASPANSKDELPPLPPASGLAPIEVDPALLGEPTKPAPRAGPPPLSAEPMPGVVQASTSSTATAALDAVIPATITPEADPAADAATLQSKVRPREMKEAGKAAARVGDEVITLHELTAGVKQRLRSMNVPPGQEIPKDQVNLVAASVLDELIERNLLNQEARRQLKNPKQLQSFMDIADKIWKEEELPPLLRKTASANEYELKEKLAEQGESYADMKDTFRQSFLARGFMEHQLGAKMKVELPEMLAYYNAHLKDFDRPAQDTWREVVIECDKFSDRASARKKAEEVFAKLRRGDDFAKVAEADSAGPNKSRGGLWETAPGSYGVETVNAALRTLPIGEISPILEGPSSYHIIRVEDRRPAGPANFADVQDKVKRTLRTQKVQNQTSAYLDKLRKQAAITTMFDGTASAPGARPPAPPQ